MLLAELIIEQEERGKVLQGLSMCKTLLCCTVMCWHLLNGKYQRSFIFPVQQIAFQSVRFQNNLVAC